MTEEETRILKQAETIVLLCAVDARQAAEKTTDPVEAERLTCEADAGCAVMHGISVLMGGSRLPTFRDRHGRPMVSYLGIALRREQVEILRCILASYDEVPTVALVLAALAADEMTS